MTDKNRDGKDDKTGADVPVRPVAPFGPATQVKPLQATKTVVVKEVPVSVPRTEGYSAGNPSGAENPGKNKTPLSADQKRDAEDAAYATKRTALDLERRKLDGTEVDATEGGLAARGDTSAAGTARLTEIDRESAALNQKRAEDLKRRA